MEVLFLAGLITFKQVLQSLKYELPRQFYPIIFITVIVGPLLLLRSDVATKV
jgi:hypothetical protein